MNCHLSFLESLIITAKHVCVLFTTGRLLYTTMQCGHICMYNYTLVTYVQLHITVMYTLDTFNYTLLSRTTSQLYIVISCCETLENHVFVTLLGLVTNTSLHVTFPRRSSNIMEHKETINRSLARDTLL